MYQAQAHKVLRENSSTSCTRRIKLVNNNFIININISNKKAQQWIIVPTLVKFSLSYIVILV